jgi:hypothetical protein
MKKLTHIILIACTLTGCASLGIGQPDKREWRVVACSGFRGWEDCKAIASRSCQKGYDIANQEENPVTQKRMFEYACKQ